MTVAELLQHTASRVAAPELHPQGVQRVVTAKKAG